MSANVFPAPNSGVTDTNGYAYKPAISRRWIIPNGDEWTISDYSSDIFAKTILSDSTYLYVLISNSTSSYVLKLRISDLTYAGQTPSIGSNNVNPNCIAVDAGYIYIGTDSTALIRKYSKTTLALLGDSAAVGGSIYNLAIDSSYVYVTVGAANCVKKYDISTLAYIASTPSYGGTPTALAIDSTYIYVGGYTTLKVRKYDIATMSFQTESASNYAGYAFYNGVLNLVYDGTNLYIAITCTDSTTYPKFIIKCQTSNMSFVGAIRYADSFNLTQYFSVDATYIWALTGAAMSGKSGTITRCLKSDLSLYDEIKLPKRCFANSFYSYDANTVFLGLGSWDYNLLLNSVSRLKNTYVIDGYERV